jgi:hypothetical protein
MRGGVRRFPESRRIPRGDLRVTPDSAGPCLVADRDDSGVDCRKESRDLGDDPQVPDREEGPHAGAAVTDNQLEAGTEILESPVDLH